MTLIQPALVSSTGSKPPAHEMAYQALREMILFGELAPGQAVTIQGLTDMLGAGVTPVREALRRMIAEGAIAPRGNRRVAVPELTRDQLEELFFVRLTVEPKLAEMAANRISGDDIAELRTIDDALNGAIERGDVRGYLQNNYRFHAAIYDRAGADILRAIADRLWLRVGPSLRVVCGRFGTLNLPDRHEDALAAMRARDAAALARAIGRDLRQGYDQIRLSLDGRTAHGRGGG